ncbi:4451_t:CDS:2, partial [Racocetra fulgida]
MNGSTLQNILSPISLEEIDKIVKINQEELLKSCQTIHQVIQEEIEIGIPPWNIFLVGYSQGGKQGIYDLREYLREKLYQYNSIKNEVALQMSFQNKINLEAN